MLKIRKEEHNAKKLQEQIEDYEVKIKDLNFDINAFKDTDEKMKD